MCGRIARRASATSSRRSSPAAAAPPTLRWPSVLPRPARLPPRPTTAMSLGDAAQAAGGESRRQIPVTLAFRMNANVL
eukprot:9519598-Heterocapsa_arctica.AAC.1